jgi:hypothetical protein
MVVVELMDEVEVHEADTVGCVMRCALCEDEEECRCGEGELEKEGSDSELHTLKMWWQW